jgi:hypothetical protein
VADIQPTGTTPSEEPTKTGEAKHGYRNEVNWGHGEGRQPYGNQGTEESGAPAAGLEEAEGNRGERSGRNLDQLEEVKRKP